MQQNSGGIKDHEVEGSLRRLSKWREGGNETEPLCADHQEELARRAAFLSRRT